jgi:hypothetical protein
VPQWGSKVKIMNFDRMNRIKAWMKTLHPFPILPAVLSVVVSTTAEAVASQAEALLAKVGLPANLSAIAASAKAEATLGGATAGQTNMIPSQTSQITLKNYASILQ